MSSATGATEAPPRSRRLEWQPAEVAEKLAETPAAATLVLSVEGWAGHRAGQHVDVRLTAEDGYQAQRSYSVASAPEPGRLSLTVERLDDGEVSPYLVDEVRAGDRFELRGPLGGWFTWHPGDGGPLLLVAGGSGIVPLMSMLRHRRALASGVPVRLLVSARTAGDLLFRRELDELAAAGDGVEVAITLTREQPPGWAGLAGRVDAALLERIAWPAEEAARTFVCGPTGFVEAVAEALVGLGQPPGRMKTERFGATGG